MSIQSTTDKVADNARNLANNVLQSAQDVMSVLVALVSSGLALTTGIIALRGALKAKKDE